MSYGKEDIDFKTDGVPSSGYLYNGADSVMWCRIRNLLSADLSVQYQTISPNCWSAEHIINEYDNFQSQFPEALWITNFKQVYLKTYKGEGLNGGKPATPTPRFLKEMWNGRKKYQRRQWLRDQESYFGTKHLTSNITSDQIMFRCNTPTGENIVVKPNYTLQIIPYSDMYLSVKFGNSAAQQIRAKAGINYSINCPFSTMDDTAVLIYCASKIQALNDLSACYIHDNDFSKATKLQRLIIGSSIPGYDNQFLTSLMLGDNKLLQYLDIRNNSKLTGSINLSKLNLLETFYAEGTSVTGITFANNGKISIAHLPASLNTLIMRNLIYLTDLQIASYDNLTSLTIQNCDIDSLGIVKESYDTLRTLNVTGISYNAENESGWYLDDTPIYDADVVGTDAPSILLEELYKITQKTNHSANIEGRIYVPTIRQKYIDRYINKWGNLSIDYRMLIIQKNITFLNADGTTVLFTEYCDASVPYQVKSYDPVGIDIITPTIQNDQKYKYTFSHWEEYTNDTPSGVPYEFGNIITDNITLIAVYTKELQEYNVTWYENADKKQILYATKVPYGSDVRYEDFANEEDFIQLQELQSKITVDNDVTFGQYKRFIGWDKSTGNVRDNIEVYGLWDETPEYIKDNVTGKYNIGKENLDDMTMTEIYAISDSKQWEKFFGDKQKSPIVFNMGTDLDFVNVESEEIVSIDNALRLNGANPFFVTDKNGEKIRLFGKDCNSFTMVVDCNMLPINNSGEDNPDDAILISALENYQNGNEGIAIRKTTNNSISVNGVVWGDKTAKVGYMNQRDIFVIRYIAETNDIIVYSFNTNPPKSVTVASLSGIINPDINTEYYCTDDGCRYRYIRDKFVQTGTDKSSNGKINSNVRANEYYDGNTIYTLTRTVPISLSNDDGVPLVIGGTCQYNEETNEYEIVQGHTPFAMIHWCKIWMDDLGDANARDLISWTREEYHAEYYHALIDSAGTYGSPYYSLEKTSSGDYKRANATFKFASPLLYNHTMNTNNTNSGGYRDTLLRSLVKFRVFNGLPPSLKQLIKTVQFKSYSASGTLATMHDKLHLTPVYAMDGSTYSGEVNNNARIPWTTSVDARLNFKGLPIDYSVGFNLSGTTYSAKYTGTTNPITTFGVYDPDTNPDGVREGSIWKNRANNTSDTGYMWITLETYNKLGLTGGNRYYITNADESTTTLGYWMSASTIWLASMNVSYSTSFYGVGSAGNVSNYNYASLAYGVLPCFSI